MPPHFEDLWLLAEGSQKLLNKTPQLLIDELQIKIGLYKAISIKSDIPIDDLLNAKTRIMGEILLSLSGLSLVDDIDVYQALSVAIASK